MYETEPVGSPEGTENFLNAVVLFDTTLSARTLLERAQAIEAAYGRDRSEDAVQNGPRTLDVVANNRDKSAAALAEALLQTSLKFCGDVPPHDDRTVLAIKIGDEFMRV